MSHHRPLLILVGLGASACPTSTELTLSATLEEPFEHRFSGFGPNARFDAMDLPPGLSLLDNGVLTGTPTLPGEQEFIVDANGSVRNTLVYVTLDVAVPADFLACGSRIEDSLDPGERRPMRLQRVEDAHGTFGLSTYGDVTVVADLGDGRFPLPPRIDDASTPSLHALRALGGPVDIELVAGDEGGPFSVGLSCPLPEITLHGPWALPLGVPAEFTLTSQDPDPTDFWRFRIGGGESVPGMGFDAATGTWAGTPSEIVTTSAYYALDRRGVEDYASGAMDIRVAPLTELVCNEPTVIEPYWQEHLPPVLLAHASLPPGTTSLRPRWNLRDGWVLYGRDAFHARPHSSGFGTVRAEDDDMAWLDGAEDVWLRIRSEDPVWEPITLTLDCQ